MDLDPEPAFFINDLEDGKKNCKVFLPINNFEGTFTLFTGHKEVTKWKESKFFLLFLLDDRRIFIKKAQKHIDPDPQHCFFCIEEFTSQIGYCTLLDFEDKNFEIQTRQHSF
jgi:hypothetical protein